MAKMILAGDLSSLVSGAFPNISEERIILPDEKYFVPARKWLFKEFMSWYGENLWKMGMWTESHGIWKDNFDCDDFARGYAWLASVCHGQVRGSYSDGIAVGELYYDIGGDPNNGHAVNCAVVDDYELIVIEPQTNKEFKLSEVERHSVDFVKF